MFKKILINLLRPQSLVAKLYIAVIMIVIFAIFALGHLDESIVFLKSESLSFKLGDFQFNLYLLVKAIISIIVLLWFAGVISDLISNRINTLSKINPSDRNLINKVFQIGLYCLIFFVALSLVGIDLTALTILSGAIGIGIGFGLQKIASNFISGIILLFEKSIEEGDLIELTDGTYGTVKKTNARFTLVETVEGREVFVPNEDFITQSVTNWTFTSSKGRIAIDVGVSYSSDLQLVRKLMLDAAIEHPMCSKIYPPECFLKEFADSSVNFMLIFWVDDIIKGRMLPKSQVMFNIWNKFKENKIEIPFPQRDIHLKESSKSK